MPVFIYIYDPSYALPLCMYVPSVSTALDVHLPSVCMSPPVYVLSVYIPPYVCPLRVYATHPCLYPLSLYVLSVCMCLVFPSCVCHLYIYAPLCVRLTVCILLLCVCPSVCMSPSCVCPHRVYVASTCIFFWIIVVGIQSPQTKVNVVGQ